MNTSQQKTFLQIFVKELVYLCFICDSVSTKIIQVSGVDHQPDEIIRFRIILKILVGLTSIIIIN